jgi:hypothetical protein
LKRVPLLDQTCRSCSSWYVASWNGFVYGNDINDTNSPLEAGLGLITKFTKEFTNSENLKKTKEAGVTRETSCFEMQRTRIPRHDFEIVDASGGIEVLLRKCNHLLWIKRWFGLRYCGKCCCGWQIFTFVFNKTMFLLKW